MLRVFGTLIAYALQISTKVLDCCYDLADKGECKEMSYYVAFNVNTYIYDVPPHQLIPFSFKDISC